MNENSRKITLLGPSNVGKTTLVYRLCFNDFSEDIPQTIGASYSELIIKGINDDDYCLQFWDTAGLEKYQAIIPMYFPNTFIYLLVFDLSDRDSLNKLCSLCFLLLEKIDFKSSRFYVIGNKKDLLDEPPMWRDEILKFVGSLKYVNYFEVSAKSGENISLLHSEFERDCCTIIIPKVLKIVPRQLEEKDKEKKCC